MFEGDNVFFLNGPLRTLKPPFNFIFAQLWFFGFYFSTASCAVQFLYSQFPPEWPDRFQMAAMEGVDYAVLEMAPVRCLVPKPRRRIEVNTVYYILMLLVGVAFVLVIFVLSLPNYPHDIDSINKKFSLFWDPEDTSRSMQISLITHSNTPNWRLYSSYVIFYIVQAVLPFIAIAVSNIYLVSSMFVSENTLFALVFMLIPMHWQPALSPLITLFAVKSYRRSLNPMRKASQSRIAPAPIAAAPVVQVVEEAVQKNSDEDDYYSSEEEPAVNVFGPIRLAEFRRQVYVVLAEKESVVAGGGKFVFPIFYVLLKNKNRQIYEKMFRMILALAPQFQPTNFNVDYELAVTQVLGSNINGCFFHMLKNFKKKIGEAGLMNRYKDANTNFAVTSRMLMWLAFVPLPSVLECFHELQSYLLRQEPSLLPVITWFSTYYVGTILRLAVFPAQLWSCYQRTVDGEDRTNNFAEASHRRLQTYLDVDHPSLGRFLEELKKIQKL
uniref:Odorant receptor n=1 Tax=Ditylenchus dipsaci TaxID=166011 RepID=A0A915DLS5_9BILA